MDSNTNRRWQASRERWQILKPLAREHRKLQTPAEAQLWKVLRDSRLGLRFRRQHAVGRFIVDFYCSKAALIIEVDGPIHDESDEEDSIRQAALEQKGLRVLRFENEDVLADLAGVLEKIEKALS
jgi:very-short-patch-repair endonuclease